MRLPLSSRFARVSRALVPAAALALGACSEGATAPDPKLAAPDVPAAAVQSLRCKAYVRDGGVVCQGIGTELGTARAVIVGGQRTYVWLRSSDVVYTAADSLFAFNLTIENLLNEALGTIDGLTLDSARVRIFFADGPVALGPGGGTVTVHNPDGVATFTAGSQPYFQYDEILAKNDTSAPKRWELKVAADSFAFTLLVAAEAQRRVVINEIMPNPAGTVQDSVGEYVEIYNAGTLRTNLKGFILNDNTAGVTDTIKTDLFVAPGGYLLLGRSANTSKNGGITPDYLYTSRIGPTSTSLTFSNSGSDLFRVRAPTGVTVDSVFYTSGTTTGVSGVARELKNPALDNTLVDGANWGAATSVYDPTTANNNRGTPKAQNSNFVP